MSDGGRQGLVLVCFKRQSSALASAARQDSGVNTWSTHEQALFSELVATRRQVDRLLEHQQVLLSMLSSTIPSISFRHQQTQLLADDGVPVNRQATPPSQVHQVQPVSSQPPLPAVASDAPAEPVGRAMEKPAVLRMEPLGVSKEAVSPVTQLLAALGAVPPGRALVTLSPAAVGIRQALQLVTQGDVLSESDLATPSTPSASSLAVPAGMQLPLLVAGVRSSWWMERLHVALLARGYYAGDDDVQSWTFGEGTVRALSRFQADHNLPVTGVSDLASWAALLSELPDLGRDISVALQDGSAPAWPSQGPPQASAPSSSVALAASGPTRMPPSPPTVVNSNSSHASLPPVSSASAASGSSGQVSKSTAFFSTSAPTSSTLPFNPSFTPMEGEQPMPLEPLDAYYLSAGMAYNATDRAGGSLPPKSAVNSQPPVMEQGDVGGFFMETLHAVLLRAGFDPSFREMDHAEFGSNTLIAVKGFQAAKKLPSTGRVDAVTWAVLLQDEADLRSAFIKAVALGSGASTSVSTSAGGSETNGPHGVVIVNSSSSNGVAHTASAPQAFGPSLVLLEEPGVASSNDTAASGSGSPGLPRSLAIGDDDVVWMSLLHRALVAQGFHPSEEECENWLFGPATQEAVLALQASAGLPETGVVCVATWHYLVREPDVEMRKEVEAAAGSSWITWLTTSEPQHGSASVESGALAGTSPVGATADAAPAPNAEIVSDGQPHMAGAAWPVIMEGDGGKHVALLQSALGMAGYHCGEDEPQWWQCGSDTISALSTFQACVSLPETGVCDPGTWQALARAVGAHASGADDLSEHVKAHSSELGMDGDLSAQEEGRVWLLGEQRWEQWRPPGAPPPGGAS